MRYAFAKSFLIAALLALVSIPPGRAAAASSDTADPYEHYESVFLGMLHEPSGFDLSPIAAYIRAHIIFNSADDALQANYVYFDDFGTPLIVSPYFIAYLFSQQYRHDPRYNLDFLIEKGEERIAKPRLESIMADFYEDYEGPEPDISDLWMFDCLFSFPHLVMGYRGKEAMPYLMSEWLDRSAVEDESYYYFEYAMRTAGAEALPYIKQALTDEELNKKQGWKLIYLLHEMTGAEIYRSIPGTPYVLDDEGRRGVGEFMFNYFFEHPYESAARAALYFIDETGFLPDTDRLIDFLKTEKDRVALIKAIELLRKHVTKDDERLPDLIPTVCEWLSDDATLRPGLHFIGMVTDAYEVQLSEPYASAFYPYVYDAFMQAEDRDIAWETFCTLYEVFQDRIIDEWGIAEIDRLISFMSEFGDSAAYIFIIKELAQRTRFDLGPYVEDIVNFIPAPPLDNGDEGDFEAIHYYLDILVLASSRNPDTVFEYLQQIHENLIPWAGISDLAAYEEIIASIQKAGITIPSELIELEK